MITTCRPAFVNTSAGRPACRRGRQNLMAAALFGALGFGTAVAQAALSAGAWAAADDSLPSWNDGPAKKSIVDFVAKVTKPDGPEFVPVAERIAVFENDGTLWAEQPIYFQFQLAFALDRVKALAPQRPEVKELEGDLPLPETVRARGRGRG